MPPCGICDFWRFPLNLLLHVDSLQLSISLLLWGFWGAGGEVLQHPEFICWLGFPVWLWETPGPCAWAGQCHVPWVCS